MKGGGNTHFTIHITTIPQRTEEQKMEITYSQFGDYMLPNLSVSNEEYHIGKYGMLRRTFLKQHHRPTYSYLLITGKLLAHLAEIDTTCQQYLDSAISAMAQSEGVTEELKAVNQMEWVQRMNNIRNRAEELALKEFVYGGF